MNAAISTFIAEKSGDTRPFTEFTSWEWDMLYVVSPDGADSDYVREVTGENVDVPWGSKSGVFIYLKDGKRVRAELMDRGTFCSGIYTQTVVVDPSFACWLNDTNMQRFLVK